MGHKIILRRVRLNRAFKCKWKTNEDGLHICTHVKIDSSDSDIKMKLLPIMLDMNYKLIFYNSLNISKDI